MARERLGLSEVVAEVNLVDFNVYDVKMAHNTVVARFPVCEFVVVCAAHFSKHSILHT